METGKAQINRYTFIKTLIIHPMEKYSHGPFEVSGYHITVEDPTDERAVIMNAWKLFFSGNIGDSITEKEYPSVHAVYYNYHDQDDLEKK